MLLPSALPCEFFTVTKSKKAQRPKLPSFDAFAPQYESPGLNSAAILASCRALQAILGGSTTSQGQYNGQTSTPPQSSPFASQPLKPRTPIQPPTRGANKRLRSEFEESSEMQENILPNQQDKDIYQTPKRQRRAPVNLPQGLLASDFDALATPKPSQADRNIIINLPPPEPAPQQDHPFFKTQKRPRRRSQDISQSQPQPQQQSTCHLEARESESECWSPSDDRRLVEAVLSKLNLSKREWNDCAKELGKDQDSLDRRWKMLVGEGNVGLRRGMGRIHERTGLDIRSW